MDLAIKLAKQHAARVIVLAMQKGGVSKTTSAVNIAAALAVKGKKVLLVDSDPQANATRSCMVPEEEFNNSLYTLYGEELEVMPPDAIITTNHGFDLLPADRDLAAIEWEFRFRHEDGVNAENATLLARTLETVRSLYDFIVIDSPPQLGTLTVNALTAATDVLIPLQPEQFGVDGLQELVVTIEEVRQYLNPIVQIAGVFLTMVSTNNLHRMADAEARGYFEGAGVKYLDTQIRRTIKFAVAAEAAQPAVLAFPKDRLVQAYASLVKEAFGV